MNQNELLAVVVLKEPKQHVIVPEKYIYGLDKFQGELKTWGVNNKVDHLIYWKRSFLDDNVIPDSSEDANFNLTPRNNFPPPPEIDSACYIARVKRFYKIETFDEAKKHRDMFRPCLPVAYYNQHGNRQPIPPTQVHDNPSNASIVTEGEVAATTDEAEVADENENASIVAEDENATATGEAVAANENENASIVAEDENATATGEAVAANENENVSIVSEGENATATGEAEIAGENENASIVSEGEYATATGEAEVANENENVSIVSEGESATATGELHYIVTEGEVAATTDEAEVAAENKNSSIVSDGENGAVEAKPMLTQLQMNESDVSAINELICENAPENAANVSIDEQSNGDGIVMVTEKIDDDIEITFTIGHAVLPFIQSTPMTTKLNDSLSGNMPYQTILDIEDKEVERHYKVIVGGRVEDVKLKKLIVDFLIRLNIERREDVSVDKAFVKGLIIAVITMQTVKANDALNPDLMEFIKDLFDIRVGNNGSERALSFDGLVLAACNEIRNMKPN